MAIAMLVEVRDLTQEQYEAAAAEINKDGPPVGGAFLHAAGPMEGGGCRIIEVWESQEIADAFYGSPRFLKVTAGMTQPTITTWPLYALDGAGLKQQPR